VLHNIGNVLNTVGVSAQLLDSQMARSKIEMLQQGVAILEANLPQIGTFLENDERGRALPDFLIKVTKHIAEERQRQREEVRHLSEHIDHMKKVISTQQGFARVANALETLSASDLVEDALRMNLPSLNRKHILVERDYGEVPPVMVDKHKALQILNNLIHNARHALEERHGDGKRLRLKIYKNGSERVKILVEDNGVGIPAENLTRIFSHGFTTRKNGHGFGLHSGALSAKEMNGSLMAQSRGVGQGAVFTLELPVAGVQYEL
jgi:two-component system NtrC family sensor kinase